MKSLELFCLLIFTLTFCGFSDADNSFLVACTADDLPCLDLSTKIFLNATSLPLPQYGLLGIDPLTIAEIEIGPEESHVNLVYTLTNVVLTGLKDEDVTGFNFDRENFNSRLQVLVKHLEVNANLKIALASNRSVSASGKFSGVGVVSLTVSYHCPIEKYPDGTEHFVVGPETTECVNHKEPTYKNDAQLLQEIAKVKELQEEKAKIQNAGSFMNNIMCKIAKKAYVSVIHNTRAAAKILPKDSFMKDI